MHRQHRSSGSRHQARFQIVDIVAAMKPLTKLSRQIISPRTIPAVVREAFRIAEEERPGPVHLELPEDVAGEETDDVPLVPPHPIELPIAPPIALDRAAEMILQAERPLVLEGIVEDALAGGDFSLMDFFGGAVGDRGDRESSLEQTNAKLQARLPCSDDGDVALCHSVDLVFLLSLHP